MSISSYVISRVISRACGDSKLSPQSFNQQPWPLHHQDSLRPCLEVILDFTIHMIEK